MSEELWHRLADFDLNVGDPGLEHAAGEASRQIAAIYADMMRRGASAEAVARAMLGATVSLYDTLGLLPLLPNVLRLVADRLEQSTGQPH